MNGFCPSFVTLQGAKIRKEAAKDLVLPEMVEPTLPTISDTYNVVITGVGGTGVVTLGAVLAQAAQIEGKGAGLMEMAGLAQKGGAVHIHLRLAKKPADISAIRVAIGEADCVIGGDLVVSGGAKTLGLMTSGRTGAVVNSHEIVTGEFTRNRDFRLPGEDLKLALSARLGKGVQFFDASVLARKALGDSIYSNMLVLGAAWQRGLVPLSLEAIREAIKLNGGAAVAANIKAFDLGRWAVAAPKEVAAFLHEEEVVQVVDPIAFRRKHLAAYGSGTLARFDALLARTPEALRVSVAKGYAHVLAVKDEYEVARLHLTSLEKAREEFEGDLRPTFHLAPPIFSGGGERPKKRAFGRGWCLCSVCWQRCAPCGAGCSIRSVGAASAASRWRISRSSRQIWHGFCPPRDAGNRRDSARIGGATALGAGGFGPVRAKRRHRPKPAARPCWRRLTRAERRSG